jgi:hypothetical protein
LAAGLAVGATTLAWAGRSDLASDRASPALRMAEKAPPSVEVSAMQRDVVILYELGERAIYMDGCFGTGMRPCLCRIRMAASLDGTFALGRTPSEDPAFEAYEITDVDWVATFRDEIIEITGYGRYETGEVDGERLQRLTMELDVGGVGLRTFDSGFVPGGDGGSTPMLDVQIRMPDSQCLNVVLDVRAGPAVDGGVAREPGPARRPRIDSVAR